MGPQFFVDGGFVCTYKGITRLLGKGSVRITPARAGKSLEWSLLQFRRRDHPRTRGEKDETRNNALVTLGSPPHARGKAEHGKEIKVSGGITPARAGKSRCHRA